MLRDTAENVIESLITELPGEARSVEMAARGSADLSEALDKEFLKVLDLMLRGFGYLGYAFAAPDLDTSSIEDRLRAFNTSGHRSILSFSPERYIQGAGYISDPEYWAQSLIGSTKAKESVIRRIDVSPSGKGVVAITFSLSAITRGFSLAFSKPRPYGRTAQDTVEDNVGDFMKSFKKLWAESVSNIFKKKFPEKAGESVTFTVPLRTMEAGPGRHREGEPFTVKVQPELQPLKHALDLTYEVKVTNTTEADNESSENFNVDFSCVLKAPLDFVMLATNTTDPEKLEKGLLWLYLRAATKAAWDKFSPAPRGKKKALDTVTWPPTIHNPLETKKTIERFTSSFPTSFKPRVNAKGWAILRDGSFRRFPDVPTNGQRMVDYVKDLSNLVVEMERAKPSDDKNNENTPDAIAEKLVRLARDKYGKRTMAVDWVNDRLVSMTEDGNLTVDQLEGVIPLHARAELRMLEEPLNGWRLSRHMKLAVAMATQRMDAGRSAAYDDLYKRQDRGATWSQARDNIDKEFPVSSHAFKTISDDRRLAAPDNDRHQIKLKHVAGIDLDDFDDMPSESRLKLLASLATIREAFKKTAPMLTVATSTSTGSEAGYADENRYGTPGWIIETVADTTPEVAHTIRDKVLAEDKRKLPNKLPNDFHVANVDSSISALPHQTEVISVSNQTPHNLVIAVATGGGKCVEGSTLVNTSRGFLRMDELVDKRGYTLAPAGLKVSAIYRDEKVTHLYKEKSRTIRLETANGFPIEGTPEHPMLVLTADLRTVWKRLDRIEIGDQIVSWGDGREALWGDYSLSIAEARLLGHMVANGSVSENPKFTCLDKTVASFSSGDVHVQSDFLHCLSACGVGDNREFDYYGERTAASYRLNVEQKALLRDAGLKPGGAAHKTIPLTVRSSGKEIVRQFFDAMFACDSGKDRDEILLVVSNKTLCQQVQTILLHGFGILSSSKRRKSSAVLKGRPGPARNYWYIWIAGEHADRFLKTFPSAKVKRHAKQLRLTRSRRDRTVDVIAGFDHAIRHVIESARVPRSKPARYTFKDGSIERYNWNLPKRNNQSPMACNRHVVESMDWDVVIPGLKRIDETFAKRVARLVKSNIRVQKVTKVVKSSREKWVYDLTIPGSHSFYANGMVSHNTVLGLTDALLKIKNAGCKRVLSITIEDLTPQMISSVNYFSKGRVNAFPLTPDVVQSMIKADKKLAKFDVFVKYIQDMAAKAPNTIFFCGDNNLKLERVLFEDEPASTGYITARDPLSQFALLIRAIGFDAVIVDEAHRIKNYDGVLKKDERKRAAPRTRSNGVQYAGCTATYRTLMSGTFTINVASDLHGALAFFDPASVGTRKEFDSRFGYDKNAVNTTHSASLLAAVADVAAYVSKTREDWAFALPRLRQHFHEVKLTPKQSAFYRDTLQMVVRQIEERIAKEKAKGGKGKASDDEDDSGNGGDDEAVVKVLRDVKLLPELVGLEMFLIAPDYDDAKVASKNRYLQLVGDEKPTGDDLISPHVKKTAQIIRDHFAGGRNDKVIVYCYHQVAVTHFEKHLPDMIPAFKDSIAIYRAGDDETVRRFQEDPKIKILIAAETSIATGYDLQISGRIIRTQGQWTPGSVEQALARIFRPDFKSETMREEIDHDWIMAYQDNGKPTIDLIKAARMFSKEYQSAVGKYGLRPDMSMRDRQRAQRWEQMLMARGIDASGFKLFVLNDPQLLLTFNSNDAVPYLRSNAALIDFESAEGNTRKVELAHKIEETTGQKVLEKDEKGNYKITNMKLFLKETMLPIGTNQDMPHSKRVYVPRVTGVKLADPHNLRLATASKEDPVKKDEYVMTEFGPGKVVKVTARGATVTCGHGDVLIALDLIDRATTPEGKVKLEAMFKNLAEHALLPFGAKLVNTGDTKAKGRKIAAKITKKGDLETPTVEDSEDQETEGEEEAIAPKKATKKATAKPTRKLKDATPVKRGAKKTTEEEDEDTSGGLRLRAVIADGMPALVMPLDGAIDEHSAIKWFKVGKYVSFKPGTPQSATQFFDLLEANFPIPESRSEEVDSLLKTYRQKRRMVADHRPDPKTAMVFFREANKRDTDEDGAGQLKPYVFSWGTEVRIAFPVRAHTTSQLTKLKSFVKRNQSKFSALKQLPDNEGFKIAFFPTYAKMEKEVEALRKTATREGIEIDTTNFDQTLKEAKALYSKIMKTKDSTPIQMNEKKSTTSKKPKALDEHAKGSDKVKAKTKSKDKDDEKKVGKKTKDEKAAPKKVAAPKSNKDTKKISGKKTADKDKKAAPKKAASKKAPSKKADKDKKKPAAKKTKAKK